MHTPQASIASTVTMYWLLGPVLSAEVAIDAQGAQGAQLGQDEPVAVEPGGVALTMKRALESFGELEPEMISTSPPILLLNKFASDEEVDALLSLGEQLDYDESQQEQTGGRSAWRTSTTAMCPLPRQVAERSPLLDALYTRASNVTQVPVDNFEPTQLVRYQAGQYYKLHVDDSFEAHAEPAGARVYTMLLFLSTVAPKTGGETVFKYADSVDGGANFRLVLPRKGAALVWPNVLDTDPDERDMTTMHAGAPLKSGVKLAANLWIRQRRYRPADEWSEAERESYAGKIRREQARRDSESR